jgi:hypothetical protein
MNALGDLQEFTSVNNHGRLAPQAPAFRHRHVALPLGTCHGQLPFGEVDVGPLERHDLAASQPRLAAQQDDQEGH